MIQILPENRWDEISSILDEADSALPTPGQANILFKESESGKIQGFVIVEMLLRVGQMYVEKTTANVPREFISYLENHIPKGSSVVVIASNERYEGLCRKLNMVEVKGKLFRRDF